MPLTSLPARVVERFAGQLRFPILFLVTAGLFVADVIFPDVVPLVDEILLGLATVLLASWKQRRVGDPDGSGVETSGTEE